MSENVVRLQKVVHCVDCYYQGRLRIATHIVDGTSLCSLHFRSRAKLNKQEPPTWKRVGGSFVRSGQPVVGDLASAALRSETLTHSAICARFHENAYTSPDVETF